MLTPKNNLLIFKETHLFDVADELGVDCTNDILAFHLGFLANCGMGVDRTAKSVFNYTDSPIPNYTTTKTFETICLERANELKQKGDLTILVSGLCSLVATKALLFSGANIELLLSYEDYQHIGNFIQGYDYKIVDKREIISGEALKNRTIITGDCGRQLYGFSNVGWYNGASKKSNSEKILLYDVIGVGRGYERQYKSSSLARFYQNKKDVFDKLYIFFCDMKNRSPIEIKTNEDLYWWLTFNLKWYSRKYRFIGFSGENILSMPFFDTLDFQSWSITNHHTKSRKVFSDFFGFDIKRKRTNLIEQNSVNGQKITWLSIFADSAGNIVHYGDKIPKNFVKDILNGEIT